MSDKCKCKTKKCSCGDTALTTPAPCPASTCIGNECPEITDAKCVIYTGDTIEEFGIPTTTNLNSIITVFAEFLPKYKSYTFLLSQVDIDDPEMIEVYNGVADSPIIWTRTDVGEYTGTLTDHFPNENRIIFSNNITQVNSIIQIYWVSPSVIGVTTSEANTNAPSDNILLKTSFEIKVYN